MNSVEQQAIDNLKEHLRQMNLILIQYTPTHFNSLGQPQPYMKYGVYTRSKNANDVKLICYGNSVDEILYKINFMKQTECNIANAMSAYKSPAKKSNHKKKMIGGRLY